jgi:hypothetical protein
MNSAPSFSGRTPHIVAHAMGWLLLFSLVLGFTTSFRADREIGGHILSPPFFIFAFIYLLLFYGNAYFLVPQLYLKRQYLLYFLILLLFLAVVALVRPFELLLSGGGPPPGRGSFPGPPPDGIRFPRPRPPRGRPTWDFTSIVLFFAVWLSGSALQLIRQWRTSEQRAVKAESEKAQAELSYLKAQIHPHFLFNTLNNIYTLTVMKSDAAPEAVLKLSHIMRYVTDEATQPLVPLAGEVAHIRNYIDLQRLRLPEQETVRFEVEGTLEGKEIPPLLLMTFIENVFKYGWSNHEPSPVTIRLQVPDRTLVFFCQNRIFGSGDRRQGIGLVNARRRLEHVYPGRHLLHIDEGNGLFTVRLTLHL